MDRRTALFAVVVVVLFVPCRADEPLKPSAVAPMTPAEIEKFKATFDAVQPAAGKQPYGRTVSENRTLRELHDTIDATILRLTATRHAAEADLEDAKRGTVDSTLKVPERRIQRSGQPIAYVFLSQAGKERSIAKRERFLASVQTLSDSAARWANPPPKLLLWELRAGDRGEVFWPATVQRVMSTTEVELQVARSGELPENGRRIILSKYSTKDMVDDKRFFLSGAFEVTGTRKVAGETMFVLEPADALPAAGLDPWKLKTGDAGPLPQDVAVRRILGPNELVVRVVQADFDDRPSVNLLLSNYPTKDLVDGKVFRPAGEFHVTETREVELANAIRTRNVTVFVLLHSAPAPETFSKK